MTEGNSTNVDDGAVKRDFENVGPMGNGTDSSNKKIKTENEENQDGGGDNDGNGNGTPSNDANEGSIGEGGQQLNWKEELAFVAPGTEGVTSINDNDVLSGRGGGTNLHPGNRQFRDLINLYRRDYLKARKNDKPAISRSIVNAIREKGGRFLKKVEKSGFWFEIGDDAAREKTSQALRQRAPEMRKLLLDHEMEAGRSQQQQQQQMMMGGIPPMMMNMNMPMMMVTGPDGNPMAFNPAMMGMANGGPGQMQMFNPALMGMAPMNFNNNNGGMPQFDFNGNLMQQQGNNNMGMDQNQMNQQQHQPQQGNNQQQPQQQQQQPQQQQQQQQDQNNQQQQLLQQQPQQQQMAQQQNPNQGMGHHSNSAMMAMNQLNQQMSAGMQSPMGGGVPDNNNQATLQATM